MALGYNSWPTHIAATPGLVGSYVHFNVESLLKRNIVYKGFISYNQFSGFYSRVTASNFAMLVSPKSYFVSLASISSRIHLSVQNGSRNRPIRTSFVNLQGREQIHLNPNQFRVNNVPNLGSVLDKVVA